MAAITSDCSSEISARSTKFAAGTVAEILAQSLVLARHPDPGGALSFPAVTGASAFIHVLAIPRSLAGGGFGGLRCWTAWA